MFNPIQLVKQIAAAAAAAFVAGFPAAALATDISGAKAAVLAGAAAGFAAAVAAAGNIVKQLWEKAHGYFNAASPEADAALVEASRLIDEARGYLG